jgi:hypothetical protein
MSRLRFRRLFRIAVLEEVAIPEREELAESGTPFGLLSIMVTAPSNIELFSLRMNRTQVKALYFMLMDL